MTSSARSGVDLEKELSCSICTEVLFQPLTLLDCLHTFCGSCLKDWFSWQQISAENAPNPPAPGSPIYTCPSCRAVVRDTRHNATVTTLLDMFLAANPDKSKPEDEKEELRQKYRPGDNVLPKVRLPHVSPEERRLEEMERRMLEQAREMSLRDAGVEPLEPSRATRRRRPRIDGERRRRADSNGRLQPDSSSDERHHSQRESQHRSRESSHARRRHVEHQSSIRSLISSSDVDSRDLEKEIDDFARQIQEEGLLDGLDLDNIDLTRNDELSRRITEAYRRRQRDRTHAELARRRNGSSASHRSEVSHSSPRLSSTDSFRPTSRHRSNSAQARPSSSTSQTEDRSRPPVTSTHLEVRGDPDWRNRRRASSTNGRSATDPIRPRTAETRPAARSQTDLTLRSRSSDREHRRPSLVDSRSTSLPVENTTAQPPSPTSGNRDLSFSGRTAATQMPVTSPVESSHEIPHEISSNERPRRTARPTSVVVPQSPLPSLGLISSSGHRPYHQRTPSQFYQEPSITCMTCGRNHIEYELHYNCRKCQGGNWNICISCYRARKGCENWFGFGYDAALQRWEKLRATPGNERCDPPHHLISSRYEPPKITPGGAEGRRTLTTDNPENRLQTGGFCSRCFAWANACFWRCEVCNEGDWGFCNNCVNQGYSCTHPLLPLSYAPPGSNIHTPPSSPSSPNFSRRPRSAQLFAGPNGVSYGNFKPLTFTTTCDICRGSISPTHRRYHCFTCTSTVVPDTQPGDYDICVKCYAGLVQERRISGENGHQGWRRCLKGHRMAIIGFTEGPDAQRRYVIQDIVGGRLLRVDAHQDAQEQGTGLQKWWWYGPDRARFERLVTLDVSSEAPSFGTEQFPPDGGTGWRGTAGWAWYPDSGAEDELLFPKGAEVREVEDVNGDWFFGSYMGVKGVFPADYVRRHEH
ncbi:hypothetical protein F4778DRAFT_149812 [Xylariomycetidae sp. FL2044]|nr:hypothetical protein F4778DRAFT_149812 [Xylariomycetidae sp. FL2044]